MNNLTIKPDPKKFGYCPIYAQFDARKLECQNIPDKSIRVFHIPLDYNHHSIFSLILITRMPITNMWIHYLQRSNKIVKTSKLDFDYDGTKGEYSISNYNKNYQILLCRSGITPYLEIEVDAGTLNESDMNIILGFTSCAWRPRSADEVLDNVGYLEEFDFAENIGITDV